MWRWPLRAYESVKKKKKLFVSTIPQLTCVAIKSHRSSCIVGLTFIRVGNKAREIEYENLYTSLELGHLKIGAHPISLSVISQVDESRSQLATPFSCRTARA